MKILFIILITFCLFLSCEKDYSGILDEFQLYAEDDNLYLRVHEGFIDTIGKFEIINKSERDIYIHYIGYPYCSFFLYNLENGTNNTWEKLSFKDEDNLWTSRVLLDSAFVVCDMVMPALKLYKNQNYQGIVEGSVLTSGKYKLIISYSFKEYVDWDERKDLSYMFYVNDK